MLIHIIIFLLLLFLVISVKKGWLDIGTLTDGQGWKLFLVVAFAGNLLGMLLSLTGNSAGNEVSNRFRKEEDTSYEKKFEVSVEGEDSLNITVQIPPKETEDTEETEDEKQESGDERHLRQRILDEIIRYNQERDDPDYYYLPGKWDGKVLEWAAPPDHTGMLIAALSLFAAAVLAMRKSKEEQEARKKREEQMLREYPGLIMKFTLLVQAGMTARRAFQKIGLDYRKKQGGRKLPAYEEVLVTCYEMESGVSELEAYRRFGERCGQMKYKTFSTLLIQNLQKGSRHLADLLEMESLEAWEERKRKARVLGETASTKLLLPMILMLLVVMALIMVPAFLSFYG